MAEYSIRDATLRSDDAPPLMVEQSTSSAARPASVMHTPSKTISRIWLCLSTMAVCENPAKTTKRFKKKRPRANKIEFREEDRPRSKGTRPKEEEVMFTLNSSGRAFCLQGRCWLDSSDVGAFSTRPPADQYDVPEDIEHVHIG